MNKEYSYLEYNNQVKLKNESGFYNLEADKKALELYLILNKILNGRVIQITDFLSLRQNISIHQLPVIKEKSLSSFLSVCFDILNF